MFRQVLMRSAFLFLPNANDGGGGGGSGGSGGGGAGGAGGGGGSGTGPLAGLTGDGQESQADLDQWKPEKDTDFDLRILPKEMRDKDPHKVIGHLHKAYKGYRDRDAAAEKAPEKAEDLKFEPDPKLKEHFPDVENDGAFKVLRTALHAEGMGPKKFQAVAAKVLQGMVDDGVIQKPMTLEGEAQKLGGTEKARERTLAAKTFVETAVANKVFDEGGKHAGRTERLAGALQGMWTHAEGVEFLEILQSNRQETGLGGGGGGSAGGVTKEQIQERMRDPKYRTDSPSFDRTFRQETDRLNRAFHGQK